MIKLHTLSLDSIVESNFNPRKSFNPTKLAELADSIKSSGVLQPILVRPLPGERVAETQRGVQYEIVAGARRFRASKQAGLADIPAILCHLSDNAALEAAILENLQRDDLTELEEAEGYEALMQHSALTAEAVGSKIGKSRSYVYGRLKLLDMSFECQQAMRDGHVDASRAVLIARIPDTALQSKALAEAMRKDYRGDVCSVRAFQSWLQANVMLRLDKATFNPADSTLVIGVGNCTTCPKRTGANPDLFTDVQGADICTDPAYYHDKEEAHRCSVLDSAERRGMRLIDGDEAGKICSQHTTYLHGYSPLTQERADTADGQVATLGQLLGNDAPEAVLIENPWTKELIAAVPTAEAEALLLARGLLKALQAKDKTASDIEGDIKRLKERAEKTSAKLFRSMAFTELAGAVHGMPDELAHKLICPLLLRAWWLRQVEDGTSNTDLAKVFGITLLKPEVKTMGELNDAQTTQMRLHVQACNQAKLFKALALWLVLEDDTSYFYDDIPDPTLYTALASEMGIDLDDIEAQATAQVRDETDAQLRTLKAQLKGQTKGTDISATGYRGPNGETWSGRGLMPKWLAVLVAAGQDKALFKITTVNLENSSTAHAPAAQAIGGGLGGPKGQGDKAPAAPASGAPLRKRKMSAADAQAAIAAAMQGQDTDPGADAQGNEVDSSQPADQPGACAPVQSLSVDARVRVTTDPERLPLTQQKYCGKEGTITQAVDGGARWMVTFRGRNGGMCVFDAGDLTPTESATPLWDETDGPDPLYDDAVAIVKKHNKASISLVQRNLKIGYNRAARLLEAMETAGMLGPMASSGHRDILGVTV